MRPNVQSGRFLEKRFSGSLEGSEVRKREYLLCEFHQSLVAVFLVLHPEDLPPLGNRAPVRPNKGDSSFVRVSQKTHKKTLVDTTLDGLETISRGGKL